MLVIGTSTLYNIPNTDIEWENLIISKKLSTILYRLRFEICIILTYLLPGHFHAKVVRYLLAKFPKLTVLNYFKPNLVPGRQAVSFKILLRQQSIKELSISYHENLKGTNPYPVCRCFRYKPIDKAFQN